MNTRPPNPVPSPLPRKSVTHFKGNNPILVGFAAGAILFGLFALSQVVAYFPGSAGQTEMTLAEKEAAADASRSPSRSRARLYPIALAGMESTATLASRGQKEHGALRERIADRGRHHRDADIAGMVESRVSSHAPGNRALWAAVLSSDAELPADPDRSGDHPLARPTGVLLAQNFSNLPHRQSLGGHQNSVCESQKENLARLRPPTTFPASPYQQAVGAFDRIGGIASDSARTPWSSSIGAADHHAARRGGKRMTSAKRSAKLVRSMISPSTVTYRHRIEFRLNRPGYNWLTRQFAHRLIPWLFLSNSIFYRLSKQLSDLLTRKWNKLSVRVVLVQLRAKI
jgi:hypothetical protein